MSPHPSSVGPYQVLSWLRTTSVFSAYRCAHTPSGRQVTLEALDDPEYPNRLDRFRHQARVLAALSHHPCVAQYIEHGIAGERHYIATGPTDGPCLSVLVGRGGPLAVPRAASYVARAAAGLLHVHRRGVIHRNVKPSAVVVGRAGGVQVVNFHLAVFAEELALERTTVLGTVDYMAPEQGRGLWLDARADIYALGCVLYFCLTGRPPYTDGCAMEKIMSHQSRQPTPIRDLRPDVPRRVVAVAERMMAREPERRYQSMAHVVRALAPYARGAVVAPTAAELG